MGLLIRGSRSNEKIPNPNSTVLEWLQKQNGFQGRVAAFGAWDVFPSIFNADRAGFPVNAGYTPFTLIPGNPQLDFLNIAKRDAPEVWDESLRLDSVSHSIGISKGAQASRPLHIAGRNR